MTLNKVTIIDQRTINEDGQILVREATYIIDIDTQERLFGPRYYRYVLSPGDNVSNYPAIIRRIANLEWTPAVIAAFLAKRIQNTTGSV